MLACTLCFAVRFTHHLTDTDHALPERGSLVSKAPHADLKFVSLIRSRLYPSHRLCQTLSSLSTSLPRPSRSRCILSDISSRVGGLAEPAQAYLHPSFRPSPSRCILFHPSDISSRVGGLPEPASSPRLVSSSCLLILFSNSLNRGRLKRERGWQDNMY
jgi:hypothetical protein